MESKDPSGSDNPNEVNLGLRHREITHMIEVLSDSSSSRVQKVKSLQLLREILPGRQYEAFIKGAVPVIRPFLQEKPNSLLLNSIITLAAFATTEGIAQYIADDIPILVGLLDPAMEAPIRIESAIFLDILADRLGPIPQFYSGANPGILVKAVSCKSFDPKFEVPALRLLSRLVSRYEILSPLICDESFLTILVRLLSNQQMRIVALNLASSIAMDPSHRGKLALIVADVLGSMPVFLSSKDQKTRYSALSLVALLTVPKEGKHKMSTDQDLPEMVNRISQSDPDEKCRKVADEIRVLVAELPLGEAIIGVGSGS